MGVIDFFVKILEEPQVTIEQAKCLNKKYAGFNCNKCIERCPQEALKDDGGGWVFEKKCDSCGLCCGICPTGAITLEKPSYPQLVAAAQEKGGVSFSCKKAEFKGDCIVPCLGYLPETLMMGLVLTCRKLKIIFDPCQCASCAPKAEILLNQRLSRLKDFALIFGRGENLIINDGGGPVTLTRGEFFTFVLGQSKTLFTPVVSEFLGKNQGGGTKASDLPVNLELFLKLVREISPTKEPALVDAEGWPFCQLKVNDDCIVCGDCGFFCPTGALKVNTGENGVSLIHNPALCMNCEVCLSKCHRQAISKGEKLDLSLVLSGESSLLRRVVGSSCPRCGRTVDINQQMGEFCSICRQESMIRLNSKRQILNF